MKRKLLKNRDLEIGQLVMMSPFSKNSWGDLGIGVVVEVRRPCNEDSYECVASVKYDIYFAKGYKGLHIIRGLYPGMLRKVE